MFHKFRLAIGAAVIFLSAAGGYAVHAAAPQALLAAGETRYAAVSTENSANTSSDLMADIPNSTVWITVPTGKTADVMFVFSAQGSTDANSSSTCRA